jgi:DNA-binding MarR family transcriptional regulator
MSGDFDPRDIDSRERDDGIHDREDEWLTIGRGPGSAVVRETDDAVRERDDERREDRDREPRDRDEDVRLDPRDVFMRDLDLPRGLERELVHDRDRDYTLNGRESRTLSTVGAFRVVSERDLRDPRDEGFDVRHLEDQGLVQRVPLNEQERAVTLTEQGRGLLERHREGHSDHRQTFYAGADRARERAPTTQTDAALLASARLLDTGETFKILSRSDVERRANLPPALTPEDAKCLKDLKMKDGVGNGVRTRDFRSHSPALYH